jgi:hypothetical protein
MLKGKFFFNYSEKEIETNQKSINTRLLFIYDLKKLTVTVDNVL